MFNLQGSNKKFGEINSYKKRCYSSAKYDIRLNEGNNSDNEQ